MGRKLRVLILIGCYPPGFRGGGPVRSIVNLVQALVEDIDFWTVTLDRDQGQPAPYADVPIGNWQTRDGAHVLYLSRAAVSIRRLSHEIASVSPDVIYLNGFFDPILTLRVLVARKAGVLRGVPILLAPRGDCSAGALKLKQTKKAIYLQVARMAGLYDGLTWQASSEMECHDILTTMKTVPRERVHIVTNLTDDVPVERARRESVSVQRALRLCFLSRISRKKNLDFALRVLADVKVPVVFTIYGPVEDPEYWATCQRLSALLPANIRTIYGGEVRPVDVRRKLVEQDLLFLPTRGENFGHVIYEALSTGVPVLISDQTPWTDLQAHGAGWNFSLDSISAFVETIEAASQIAPDRYDVMAQNAMAYASTRTDRQASIQKTYELFKGLALQ